MVNLDYIIENTQDKNSRIFLVKDAIYGKLTVKDFLIHSNMKPTALEKIIAKIAMKFETITRIEISLLTGLSLPVLDSEIENMVIQGYLAYSNKFSKKKLKSNIKEIKDKIDNYFEYYETKNLVKSSFIKQYTLTENGRNLVINDMKNSEERMDELECVIVIFDDLLLTISYSNNGNHIPKGNNSTIGPEYFSNYELFLQEHSDIILGENRTFKMLTETSSLKLYENEDCQVFIGENNKTDNEIFLITNGMRSINYSFEGKNYFKYLIDIFSIFKNQIINEIFPRKSDYDKYTMANSFNAKMVTNIDNTRKIGCLIDFNLKNEQIVNYLAESKPHLFLDFKSEHYKINFEEEIYLSRFKITCGLRSKDCQYACAYYHNKISKPKTRILLLSEIEEESNNIIEKIKGDYFNINIYSKKLAEYIIQREMELPFENKTIYVFEDEAKNEAENFLNSNSLKGDISIYTDSTDLDAIIELESGFKKFRIEKIKHRISIERESSKRNFDLILLPKNNSETLINFIASKIANKIENKLISLSTLENLVLNEEKEISKIAAQYEDIEVAKLPADFTKPIIEYLRKVLKLNLYIIEEESNRELQRIIEKGLMNKAEVKEITIEKNHVKSIIAINNDLFEKIELIQLPSILRSEIIKRTFDNYPDEQTYTLEIKLIVKDNAANGLNSIVALRLGHSKQNSITYLEELHEYSKNSFDELVELGLKHQIDISHTKPKFNFDSCLSKAKENFKLYIKEEQIKKYLLNLLKLSQMDEIFISKISKSPKVTVLLNEEKIDEYQKDDVIIETVSKQVIRIKDNLEINFNLEILPINVNALLKLVEVRSINKFKKKPLPKHEAINIAKSLAGSMIKKINEYKELNTETDISSIFESLILEKTKNENIFIEDYLAKEINKKYPSLKYRVKSSLNGNKVVLLLNEQNINQIYNAKDLANIFEESIHFTIKLNKKQEISYELMILPLYDASSNDNLKSFIMYSIVNIVLNNPYSYDQIIKLAKKVLIKIDELSKTFDLQINPIEITKDWLIKLLKDNFKEKIIIKEEIIQQKLEDILPNQFTRRMKSNFEEEKIIINTGRREISLLAKLDKIELFVLNLKIPYLEKGESEEFMVIFSPKSQREFIELLKIRYDKLNLKESTSKEQNEFYLKSLDLYQCDENERNELLNKKDEILKSLQ